MAKKETDPRPGWDEYFMMIAEVVATRSNCSRRHVWAVMVKDRHILSTGYNGTPHGVKNCFAGGCPRCSGKAESGSHLEECLCVHAEQNAIAQARNLLQQQMNVEQQAADAVVRNLLVEVTEEWRKEHDDVDMIVARQQLVFCKPEFDVTGELIEKINEKTPKFPDLPKVSINKK